MYSRAAISKQANIVNSNSLTFARALSSGNNEINNAILVDYNHVPRQYWPVRFWLATVKSRDNYCKIRSPESSINLDPDFFLFFSFFFLFLYIFLIVKQSYERRSYNFWVDVRESEGEMIDRLGIDVKLWLNISFNFQQMMLLRIFCLNINLACIFELLCIFFQYRGIVSLLCCCWSKTCFYYYFDWKYV